jgi:predicted GNAT family N-acyltransferase
MTSDAIQTEVVSWNLHGETLRSIRSKVFVEEQSVPEEIESDGQDDSAIHFLVTRNTVALGCGRLLTDGKVGRMAVLREERGTGVGAQLLKGIVSHARRNGFRRLYLHAQSHALDFYLRAGFVPTGDEFAEAGIPHQGMELQIDYTGADEFIAGVGYPQPFADLSYELARSARRTLRIYSRSLDREVFDNTELTTAMTALAARSRHTDIRILINDAKPIAMQGHRVLTLTRRLSSTMQIRVLAEHPSLPEATFLIRDNNGIVYKPDDRGRAGFYEPASRASAKRFLDKFDTLWHWGVVDPRLRSLRL